MIRRSLCAAALAAASMGATRADDAADEKSKVTLVYDHVLPNVPGKSLRAVLVDEARFRWVLVDRFDMAAISKFVLGRYWRSTNEAQRAEFQRLFVDFMVGSYSSRFSDYLGEGVRVTGSGAEDGGSILVHSTIDMPSAEDIRVDWRLRRAGGNFAIVDIIVEGASMEVTQRSAFASMIQDRGGIDGLIEALRTKNLQSANSSSGQ